MSVSVSALGYAPLLRVFSFPLCGVQSLPLELVRGGSLSMALLLSYCSFSCSAIRDCVSPLLFVPFILSPPPRGSVCFFVLSGVDWELTWHFCSAKKFFGLNCAPRRVSCAYLMCCVPLTQRRCDLDLMYFTVFCDFVRSMVPPILLCFFSLGLCFGNCFFGLPLSALRYIILRFWREARFNFFIPYENTFG